MYTPKIRGVTLDIRGVTLNIRDVLMTDFPNSFLLQNPKFLFRVTPNIRGVPTNYSIVILTQNVGRWTGVVLRFLTMYDTCM